MGCIVILQSLPVFLDTAHYSHWKQHGLFARLNWPCNHTSQGMAKGVSSSIAIWDKTFPAPSKLLIRVQIFFFF